VGRQHADPPELIQWQEHPPPQQCPPPFPLPLEGVETLSPPADAKTESFLVSLVEPQCGQVVPFQSLERTRISLSRSHFSQ
jgi:hypothetical protein